MIILFLSDGQIIIVPKDKVEECLKVIEKALDEGKTKITFLGQTFEITKILLDELKQRVKEKPSKNLVILQKEKVRDLNKRIYLQS